MNKSHRIIRNTPYFLIIY